MNWKKILNRLSDSELISVSSPSVSIALESGTLTPHNRRALITNFSYKEARDKRLLVSLLLPRLDRVDIDYLCNSGIQLDSGRSEREDTKILSYLFASNESDTQQTALIQDVSMNNARILFPHQLDALRRITDMRSAGVSAVMLHLPTGVGKTRTAVRLLVNTLLGSRQGSIVFWLASRSELLAQASAEFVLAWQLVGDRPCKIARLWGDTEVVTEEITSCDTCVVFAGFQKMRPLISDATFLPAFKRSILCVVDEAHQSLAPSYFDVIKACTSWNTSGSFLLGLTATPGRTWNDPQEDAKLSEIYSNNKVMLQVPGYDNPVTALIDQGYLSRPRFIEIQFDEAIFQVQPDSDGIDDYPDSVLDSLGSYLDRNKAIANLIASAAASRRRIIAFMPSVLSCKVVAFLLSAVNLDSFVISGSTPMGDRNYAYSEFSSDSQAPIVLLNHSVLTAGFDAPKTDCVIVCRPTKSLVSYSQMVGRALRGPLAGGTATCDIYTLIDLQLAGFSDVAQAFSNWEDVWS
jgi:DNA repair protein RadD